MGQQDSGFSAGTVLLSFFIGGIIGAGVALLTAPKTGQETRKMIKEFAEDARDRAEEYVGQVKEKASGLVDRGRELLDKEKNIISKAVEAGKEAYEREKQG
ncbi:MAG: YtxH-like protein [Syntrophorhabdus sp. PtaB.Bin184]|jgi:gas vesicle protein|nr:MAG: YtxH-like protein [Syntrophorhabdus sp. PtaB.Bin184]